MRAKEIIDQMAAKGYWNSPGTKTPHATVVAAKAKWDTELSCGVRYVRAVA